MIPSGLRNEFVTTPFPTVRAVLQAALAPSSLSTILKLTFNPKKKKIIIIKREKKEKGKLLIV